MLNAKERLASLHQAHRRCPTPESEAALWTELLKWTQHAARRKARSTGMPREDLASEFLMALVKAMPQAPEQQFPRWVNTVIRNRHLDVVRESTTEKREAKLESLENHPNATDTTALVDHIDYELLSPQDQRLAGLLFQGYTLTEIAEQEQVSVSAIKMRFARMREAHTDI